MNDLSPAVPRRSPVSAPLARGGAGAQREGALGLGAFALGALGEALLFPEATRVMGAGLLVAAMGLAASPPGKTAGTAPC